MTFKNALIGVLGAGLLLIALSADFHRFGDWNGMRPDDTLGSSTVSLFSLFDGVGLYQKNGFAEVYGASLRQRNGGPIRIARTTLEASDDRAYVFWSPDFSPARGATHVEVRLHAGRPAGRLTVGLTSASGKTYLFQAGIGPEAPPAQPRPLPPLVPEKFLAAIGRAAPPIPLVRQPSGALVAPLPPQLVAELNADGSGEKAITTFFVLVDNAAGSTVAFDRIALVRQASTNAVPAKAAVAGSVSGALIAPGTTIQLVTETGERLEQQLSLDNHFRFDGLSTAVPFSIRYQHKKRDYYSTLGRWLRLEADRTDLRIALEPSYSNPDGHSADPRQARFVVPRAPSTVGAIYEPHARQYWPGFATLQEYDSTTFTNNMGFVDRDRFVDNPDACLRVVHLGSSVAVALQVRPFEKYNIVVESDLGVLLQRCVEMISAGRDNGDIGSNYLRLRDYAIKFRPDVILLENSSSLAMQLHPRLLKLVTGWDHAFNALDNFYYDANGLLRFRSWTLEYALHATPPSFSELTPGVPLTKTLQVPFTHMHPWGRETFRYLADIMTYFKTHHPEQRFIVHTGLDEAQCRDACNTMATPRNGARVPLGASTFVANHKAFCEKHGLECIHAPFPAGYNTPDTYLTFVSDGHYSVRGHQWLARELSAGLLQRLRKH